MVDRSVKPGQLVLQLIPDEQQLEIFYLLEEGERHKAMAKALNAPAVAEKYGFTEQWIRAIRQKFREQFGTYSEGYKGDWDEFKRKIEEGG